MTLALSKPLLSVNGVPPQIIDRLTPSELASLTEKATRNKDNTIWRSALVKPAKISGIGKCNAVCAAVIGAMDAWGAYVQGNSFDIHYRNSKSVAVPSQRGLTFIQTLRMLLGF